MFGGVCNAPTGRLAAYGVSPTIEYYQAAVRKGRVAYYFPPLNFAMERPTRQISSKKLENTWPTSVTD